MGPRTARCQGVGGLRRAAFSWRESRITWEARTAAGSARFASQTLGFGSARCRVRGGRGRRRAELRAQGLTVAAAGPLSAAPASLARCRAPRSPAQVPRARPREQGVAGPQGPEGTLVPSEINPMGFLSGAQGKWGSRDDVTWFHTYRGPPRIPAMTVACGWSPWTPWSLCSRSCNVGIRRRFRAGTAPPAAFGGAPCQGPDMEAEFCSLRPCRGESCDRGPQNAPERS